ncbi:MAG: SDR family NAD(P)-dependent oxidoreductase [Caldilineaceae bacterium]
MKSLWNEADAAPFADDPLQLRVYSSRLLGGDPALVLHGGGNTSVKATVPDLFGDPVEVLYVKGSGWDLGTIAAPGFAPVRMDTLRRMADLPQLSDSDMVKHQRAAMLDPNAPNPSVEAILHAIIPFRYVDHSHADAICTICNTPDGAARIRELFGPDMFFVPYVMPGFVLARTVYEMTRNVDWDKLSGILLMSHGLFTFADSARASYEKHIALVNQAEEYIAANARAFASVEVEPADENLPALAHLRRAVSHMLGAPLLAVTDASAEAVRFANLPNVANVATRGLLTPDHVIRTGRIPLVLSGDAAIAPAQIDADVAAFAQNYTAYFERHTDGHLTMLDAAPRWAVWPGAGTVAFGRTVGAVNIVNDIKRHTIRAIHAAEALERWQTLGEREIFDIEYWELEQAKLKKGGSTPPLQGKIAIVTGAASGIGRACVEALHAQGAVVAALDIQPQVQEMYAAGRAGHDLRCDQGSGIAAGRGGNRAPLWRHRHPDWQCRRLPSSQPIAHMGREQWSAAWRSI